MSETFEHGDWTVGVKLGSGDWFEIRFRGNSVEPGAFTAHELSLLRTAITAALGDGALVVTAERLRDALMDAHTLGWRQAKRGEFEHSSIAIGPMLAALTAPEVEG